MKPKNCKLLAVIIALVCILPLASLPNTIATPARPKLSVQPTRNVFSTDVTKIGGTFSINIVTSGWEAPGLYSYELKLYFDPTLLEAIEAKYPAGHFLPAPNFEVPPEMNNEKGYVLFGVTKLGDVPGSTGSGTLATVTFKIIKAPPPALSCNLEIKDIILLDPAGNTITEYDVEHGYYEFSLPKAPVYLKVTPEIVGAAKVGSRVTVFITINSLRAVEKLVAIQWKLRFDPSLLEVVEVTEGNFLKSEAEKAKTQTGEEYGTAFDWKWDTGTDYVLSFTLYYKMPWPPTVFPEGSGTLAILTFNAIQMPTELTRTDLVLFDVIMVDVEGNEIIYNRVENGVYIAPIELADLNMDMKVNIQDLYIFGIAFGSYPGHPRWDPRADINSDGKVNILDGVIIAKAFHT
jgi:hypothetical protein